VTRQLLHGCLEPPGETGLLQLASAVGAKPYGDLRRKRELGDQDPVINALPQAKQAQRTRVSVTAFQGWDLAGPSAGSLEYREEKISIDWIDNASGQPLKPVRVSTDRSCTLNAPVADARDMFEIFESMTDRIYGIRISADRRWVDVFMFDPDQYDTELSFNLEKPLPGLAQDSDDKGESRLAISDAGPRVSNYGDPRIPIVTLTRAAFLAGLDQPAAMNLLNEVIQPVVQRLAAAP
jgi:hypothetical protein